MKFCRECYRLLDDSARFCDKCGSAQPPYQYSQPVQPPPTPVPSQPLEPQPAVLSPPPQPQPVAVPPPKHPRRGILGIAIPNSLRQVAIAVAIIASALIARAIALTAIPIDPYWDRVEE